MRIAVAVVSEPAVLHIDCEQGEDSRRKDLHLHDAFRFSFFL